MEIEDEMNVPSVRRVGDHERVQSAIEGTFVVDSAGVGGRFEERAMEAVALGGELGLRSGRCRQRPEEPHSPRAAGRSLGDLLSGEEGTEWGGTIGEQTADLTRKAFLGRDDLGDIRFGHSKEYSRTT